MRRRPRAGGFVPRHHAHQRDLIALHLDGAGHCRRAAMEAAATGRPVGFYGPELHKDSARRYLADVRQRRLAAPQVAL